MDRLRVAVHKFSSCDGCQLAFLNLGETLLELSALVDIRHFAEAGMLDETAEVDVAFVEGSISTSADQARIRDIRKRSRVLVTLGACAASGGLQALRNLSAGGWLEAVYATPEYIDSLERVMPVSAEVRVDLELRGCPVSSQQVLNALRSLSFGVLPPERADALCLDCKRAGLVCVMVAHGEPCLGPVTRTGCGALCPAAGRGCYGCYGPDENPNGAALSRRLEGLGLVAREIADRFHGINSQAPGFLEAGRRAREEE